MSDRKLTVALAQISPVWLDREATVDKVVRWIDDASVVIPDLDQCSGDAGNADRLPVPVQNECWSIE